MYTIDEFIHRLQTLREIAPMAGQTPVVVEILSGDEQFEPAEVELQPVNTEEVPGVICARWRTYDDGNMLQVAKVF